MNRNQFIGGGLSFSLAVTGSIWAFQSAKDCPVAVKCYELMSTEIPEMPHVPDGNSNSAPGDYSGSVVMVGGNSNNNAGTMKLSLNTPTIIIQKS